MHIVVAFCGAQKAKGVVEIQRVADTLVVVGLEHALVGLKSKEMVVE